MHVNSTLFPVVLREELDVLDFMIIVEAAWTHKNRKKPLVWKKLEKTPRFNFVNRSKIIHFAFDNDSNTGKNSRLICNYLPINVHFRVSLNDNKMVLSLS